MFIAHDFCGWMERYGRYTTCFPDNNETLTCAAWMTQKDWDKAQLEFLQKFPGITVHKCPGVYTTVGTEVMGTTDEICDRLRKRLA